MHWPARLAQIFRHGDPPTEVTTVEKIRRLPWSVATDSANTAFLQLTFTGSVFVLFLRALGLGKGETGVLLSLLPFASAGALLTAPRVVRFGYKRTVLLFFAARTLTAAALLLLPWLLAHFGHRVTLAYVIASVAAFGLLRSISLTAYFPWAKDYVPDAIRGKYVAINNAVTSFVGFLAIIGARFGLAWFPGVAGYRVLIALGVALGGLAVAAASRIPGGAPPADPETATLTRCDLKEALQDRDFVAYLAGVGLYAFALTPVYGFLPLFMQEQVGLAVGNIVLLQAGTLLGGC